MKTHLNYLLIAALIVLTSVDAPVNSKYAIAKGHTVTIHGTSNLHAWDERVGTVTGDGLVLWNGNSSFDLLAMNIRMEGRSIKSTEGSIMNNNTYKALKADDHPFIIFALMTPLKAIPANAGKKAITAGVNLTIAGVTKRIDMSVAATAQGHGNIEFEGSKIIKMTDYGIKPPVAMFGTLKTGDEITIHFKTVLAISN